MRATRFALIALAAVVFSAFTARPASAAPWQLCLRLVGGGANDYFMNFVVQGNAILVTGTKNVFGDDHGPLFGSLSKPPNSGPNGAYELGLKIGKDPQSQVVQVLCDSARMIGKNVSVEPFVEFGQHEIGLPFVDRMTVGLQRLAQALHVLR